MSRLTSILWLVFSNLVPALPALATGAENGPPSALQAVAELEKRVSYAETKIPLAELVQRVAEDTGAKLTASKDTADEPVAVAVKGLPARELLEQLADLLDYQWSRRGREGARRYEIWQDLASKQREEALRQAMLNQAQARLRQEIDEAVAIAALPETAIKRLLDEADKHREELQELAPQQRQALLNSPEERAQTRKFEIARELQLPMSRLLVQHIGRLTPAHWALLRHEGTVVFADEPQPGELPFPPQTARSLRLAQQARGSAAATNYRVTISLNTKLLQVEGSLSMSAVLTPTRNSASSAPVPHGVALTLGRGGGFTTSGMGTVVFFYARPADTSRQAEIMTQQQADLDQDPVLGVRKVFRHANRQPAPGIAGTLTRALLPDLARAYGVQFIADAYWGRSIAIPIHLLATGEPMALHMLLDRYSALVDHWDRRGSLIRLRSRTWFFDRPREIPLRRIRHWKNLYEKHGALPMDDYIEMLVTLSSDQWSNLENVAQPAGLSADFYRISRCRSALMLYASLTPDQRRALWQGTVISVAEMTPRQRDLFLIGLQRLQGLATSPIDLADVASGFFSLTSKPVSRVREQRGDLIHYRDEPAPRTNSSSTASIAPTQYPVIHVEFHVHWGPGRRESTGITIASPS